jgi:hypothetical protein
VTASIISRVVTSQMSDDDVSAGFRCPIELAWVILNKSVQSRALAPEFGLSRFKMTQAFSITCLQCGQAHLLGLTCCLELLKQEGPAPSPRTLQDLSEIAVERRQGGIDPGPMRRGPLLLGRQPVAGSA